MAAKRVTSLNINWTAFIERAPTQQTAQALAFKTKVDGYVRKMAAFPEKPPAIDWAFYKSKVGIPGMVDTFQKKYESLSIPYPIDTLSDKIEQEKKEKVAEASAFVKEVDAEILKTEQKLTHLRNIMPFTEMSMEDFQETFPDRAINMFTRPSHWPHTEAELRDAEYYVKTGKIPDHLDVTKTSGGH